MQRVRVGVGLRVGGRVDKGWVRLRVRLRPRLRVQG